MIDKNKIKIRKLTAFDAEQYVKLHNIVWRHAYKHIFPKEVFEDRDARTQSRIDSFADWIDINPNQINYCAEVDGEIDWFLEELADKTMSIERNLIQNINLQQKYLEIGDKTR